DFGLSMRPWSTCFFPYTTLFRSLRGHNRFECDLSWLSQIHKICGCAAERTLDQLDSVAGLSATLSIRQFLLLPLPDLQSALGSTDRKSTRLNSSHGSISYAVFCL